MEILIIFILATSGLSWILCRSKLFKPFREKLTYIEEDMKSAIAFSRYVFKPKLKVVAFLGGLFGCVGCMGFWTGMLNYFLLGGSSGIKALVFGFVGSITSLFIVTYIGYLARK